MFETESKTVPITREMVRAAYKKVKQNKGSAGVDNESLEEFQKDLSKNLYQLWNRLTSGSYFPKPVREVGIPKANGGQRKLGIPTVSDRIAQQVVKTYLEPRLEAEFHSNSYGYRPLKSAHQAINQVQENVREFAWVIDMDIKSFFDEVDHELLMKAVDRHVDEKWVKMYIRRWLECPKQSLNETLVTKEGKGTPQGGVISPLLANLYLHYVLDKWLALNYPDVAFVRYADDVIAHCKSEEESKEILERIKDRLNKCKLRLNESKTGIIYCKDYRRWQKKDYRSKFDFLGFSFKPQMRKSKYGTGKLYLGYGCEISKDARKRILSGWKELKWHRQSNLSIQEIADMINPQMRGLIRYFGKFSQKSIHEIIRFLHFRLAKWVLNKYKRSKGQYRSGYQWLKRIQKNYPNLFYHWTIYRWV